MMHRDVSLKLLIAPARTTRAGRGDFPVLSMTMHKGLVDQATKFKKRVASTDTSDYKVVRRNQLVVGFPIDEGVLSIQDLYDEAIVSPAYDVWDLRRDYEIDPAYLERFLRSPRALAFYRAKLRGTTARRRTIPDDVFLNLLVPLPLLSEQRLVAEILDKADALRAMRRAALDQLDTLTQTIFLDMFGDPATNPKGWPTLPLGEAMTEVYRYPTYYGITYVRDGVPEIRGELLNEDGTITSERSRLRFISPDTSARFPRTILQEGDLVMSVRGTVGKIAVVPRALAGSNMTANLLRLSPDRDVLDPVFVWYCTQMAWFKAQLANACSSTTILTIRAPDLKRIPIPVPPIRHQREFAKRIATAAKLKASQDASLSQLHALFGSLQDRAFRGEL